VACYLSTRPKTPLGNGVNLGFKRSPICMYCTTACSKETSSATWCTMFMPSYLFEYGYSSFSPLAFWSDDNLYHIQCYAAAQTIIDAEARFPGLFADVNAGTPPAGAAAFIATDYAANKANEDTTNS